MRRKQDYKEKKLNINSSIIFYCKLAWVLSAVSNLALSYVVVNNIRMIQKAQTM